MTTRLVKKKKRERERDLCECETGKLVGGHSGPAWPLSDSGL